MPTHCAVPRCAQTRLHGHQDNIKNGVCLVYDPLKTQQVRDHTTPNVRPCVRRKVHSAAKAKRLVAMSLSSHRSTVWQSLDTMQGGLSFRAIRLTTSFMELYRSGNFSAESIAKADLTAVDIFQEVPIQFHNTALIRALLHDYDMGNKLNCDFERLNLTCACALLCAFRRLPEPVP